MSKIQTAKTATPAAPVVPVVPDGVDLGFFQPVTAADLPPYLKQNIFGTAGSGKSHSAALTASGLARYIQSKTGVLPPVFWLDTEKSIGWVKTLFDTAGVPFYGKPTRKFADLITGVETAAKNKGIIVVDSLTHFWEALIEAFQEAKRQRTGRASVSIEIQDWGLIKKRWAKFTTLMLESNCHIIMTGRAASMYDTIESEDGRRSQVADGVRMGAEKNFSHEPHLVIMLELDQRNLVDGRVFSHVATVTKDRSTLINGKTFNELNFGHILPHVQFLNIGNDMEAIYSGPTNTDSFSIAREQNTVAMRAAFLADITHLFQLHGLNGTAKADVTKRAQLMQQYFGGPMERLETAPIIDLQEGVSNLRNHLTTLALADGAAATVATNNSSGKSGLDDEIPTFDEGGHKKKGTRNGKAAASPQS